MTEHYDDYLWKDGIPYGVGKTQDKDRNITYKILMDPYRKHISIEQYGKGAFKKVIYDSQLLDFRKLKPAEQNAWQKETMAENSEPISLIRNQDDRIVYMETYTFDNNLCRECRAHSPHGIPLSRQRMYYKELGDTFNGVILYDCNDHPVMSKTYEFDVETGEFTDLINENWHLEKSK